MAQSTATPMVDTSRIPVRHPGILCRIGLVTFLLGLIFAHESPAADNTDARFGKGEGLVVGYTDWSGDPVPISQVVVCDIEYNPLPDAIRESSPGRGIVNTDLYDRFTFLIWCNVPGFGRLKFYADNGGAGYSEKDHRLDLNLELARSRVLNVRSRVTKSNLPLSAFSSDTISRLEDAEGLLAAALESERPHYRVKLLEECFKAGLWAGEMVVLDEAKARIASTPRRLSFKFGANAFKYGQGFPDYEDRFLELFNFATVPFYLKGYEPEEGQPRPQNNENSVAWLIEHGIDVKGHPLVWFYKGTQPEWAAEKAAPDAMRELVRDRVLRDVGYWKDRIQFWDVINEAHDWANCYGYTSDEMIDFTRIAAEAAREANPRAVRIVNLCYLTGEYAAGTRNADIDVAGPLMTPWQYGQRITGKKDAVPFEVLGLQFYFPSLDLFEIARMIDRFATLGKPIHITELAAPSSSEMDEWAILSSPDAVRNLGVWHRPWDPELQADWLEAFYTIAYANPNVHAITYWDFADYKNHFFAHGGMLDREGQPKPVFHRLKSLFQQWGVGPYQYQWAPGLAGTVASPTQSIQ